MDDRPLAVVVGGGRDLGAAIADDLAEAGHRVVVTWRSSPAEDHPGYRLDVTDGEQVDATFAAIAADHGLPATVVANAGEASVNLVLRERGDRFREVLETNLVGALHVGRAAGRLMARARTGSIVYVSSVSALWGTPGLASYTASKAGLVGLARTLARELARRGVTVNVVAPGLLENLVDVVPGGDEWVAATPLGRAGTFAEVAAVVRYLASPGARYVTGAFLPVDGGFAMGRT